jgi:hypothetical protein
MRGNGRILSMVGICQVQTSASGSAKYLWYPARIRVALDKGSGTNLKQIEPWTGSFFTLRKHFFLRYNECVQRLGVQFEGSNIKNVIDMWDPIFGLFLFFFCFHSVFFKFLFHFLLLLHTMNEHSTRYWWLLFLTTVVHRVIVQVVALYCVTLGQDWNMMIHLHFVHFEGVKMCSL